ncbi:reverse transcriptase family protein [bacterium]|nr:reverse transcriptase family protein [bacterium]
MHADAYSTACAAGILRTVVRGDGILDADLLRSERPVQMLCLLADCVSAAPRDEDARVQDAFSYAASTYEPSGGRHGYARQSAWRHLGSVTTHQPPAGSTASPTISQLHCKWSPGRANGRDVRPQGSGAGRGAEPPLLDDDASRAHQLSQCLDRLVLPPTANERPLVAFAWSDLRESTLLRHAIAQFAIARRVDVLIVQRSAHRFMQMRDALRTEVTDAARDARAYIAQSCRNKPLFRDAATALCSSIESDLLAQVGSIATTTPDSATDLPEMSPTAARLFGFESGQSDGGAFRRAFAAAPERNSRAADRQHAAAAREVQRSNELTDQDFRDKLKARWAKGDISFTTLEEMRRSSRQVRAAAGEVSCATTGISLYGDSTNSRDDYALTVPRAPTDDTGTTVPSNVAVPEEERFKVTSAAGAHTPLHLSGLALYDESGLLPTTVDIKDNICDGGSGTCLLGLGLLKELERRAPGAVRRVAPLPSSVQRVLGIGAMNEVVCWTSFTLQLGGRLVELEDVPVLRNHSGLLLGNDFLGAVRASLSYGSDLKDCDGSLLLRSKDGAVASQEIAFTHRVGGSQLGASTFLASTITDAADTRYAQLQCELADDGYVSLQIDVRVNWEETMVDDIISTIDPHAFTPERTVVPAWCEKLVKCRVPASIAKGADVALLPLEDATLPDLGVLVAPCVQRPTEDGFVWARVVNTSREEVSIPMLTPIARFIIDPRTAPLATEYDVNQVMEKINIGKLSDSDLAKCRAMLMRRLALFRSRLGYAHPMKVEIRTVPGATPPNASNRVRPPKEVKALEEMADDLYTQDIIEPANRSPFNALPMIVWKPDGSLRPVVDWRSLNLISEKDTHPLPNVEANLAALGKADFFTTIDLLSGFLQCELTDDSKVKTAFTIGNKQWQYKRMPMGLTSSPSSFMRMVDAALRGLPPGIAYAYV